LNADEHWARSQELFHELIALAPPARAGRLAALAAADRRMAEELEALLAADETEDPVVEQVGPAVEALFDSPDLEEGATFGPYRITGWIGRGGMGQVYRATRDDTGQDLAIKVLDRMFDIAAADRERFTREQRTLARLNHSGIAHLHDADTFADGTPWFAMEHVAGGAPITDYCRREDLDVSQRLQLFAEVCQAVRHAHRHAVIHRDLKPSNILVRADGVIKLVDFGIAVHLTDVDSPSDAAVGRTLTPSSAAPEQLTGQSIGLYSDVYALGNVLFELLTDAKPFPLDGRSDGDISRIVVEQQPPTPSSVEPGVRHRLGRTAWRELDAICLRLLRKAPEERPTIDALVADLEALERDRPVLAYSSASWYRLRKFVGRHTGAVAGAGVAVALVTALAATAAYRLARERQATLDEAARTARLQQFMLGLFTGEQPEAGPARTLTVPMLLDRGVLTAEALKSDPDVRAELWQTIGIIFGQLGDLGRAEALLTRSLDDRQRRLPSRDPRVVEGLVMLSLLRTDQAQLAEAERLARDAVARLADTLPHGHPLAIKAQVALGKALIARSAYAEAIAVLAPVVQARPALAESPEWAAALTELANAHQYAGNLADADRLNRRALEVDRRVHGNFHPTVADDLINLGAASHTRGEHAVAERLKREALVILEGWYGPDHPETGSAALLLAQALSPLDRLDEAAALLDKARRAFERAYAGPHRRIGLVHNDIGALALRRGRHDEAIASFRRALEVYRTVYPDGRSQYISVALANLGTAYLEKGQVTEAERLLREAVALSTTVLTRTHSSTAIAELKLGRALLRQKRFGEAVPFLESGRATLAANTPSASWLPRSADDLAAAYDALGRSADADRLRAPR
jgi:serine/threonine-protein kinase